MGYDQNSWKNYIPSIAILNSNILFFLINKRDHLCCVRISKYKSWDITLIVWESREITKHTNSRFIIAFNKIRPFDLPVQLKIYFIFAVEFFFFFFTNFRSWNKKDSDILIKHALDISFCTQCVATNVILIVYASGYNIRTDLSLIIDLLNFVGSCKLDCRLTILGCGWVTFGGT